MAKFFEVHSKLGSHLALVNKEHVVQVRESDNGSTIILSTCAPETNSFDSRCIVEAEETLEQVKELMRYAQ